MKSTKKGLLFAALAVSLATLPGQFAQAQDVAAQPVDVATVQAMVNQWNKNWYAADGQFIMSLEGGNINGCPILGGSVAHTDRGTIGNFKIQEPERVRDIVIKHSGMGMHEQLVIDNVWNLSPYNYAAHYESVGGIYLGETKAQVEAVYGKPIRSNWTPEVETWYYDSLGLQMDFEAGRIVSITFKATGDRRLDRTGFDCKTSPEEFARLYPTGAVPQKGGVYYIADGEFLDFTNYPDSLTLSIYNHHVQEPQYVPQKAL